MENTLSQTSSRGALNVAENILPQNEPLIAILIGPNGPVELWVLGRESLSGKAAPEDIRLGEEWIERLASLEASSPQSG